MLLQSSHGSINATTTFSQAHHKITCLPVDSLQVYNFSCDGQHLSDGLQLPALPSRLAVLSASAIVPPLWEAVCITALTGLELGGLAAATVQPALAALQHLPSLHSFALTNAPLVGGHLGALAPGIHLRSLTIAKCGLDDLPKLQGSWANGLTYLDLSHNNLAHFPPIVRSMLQLKILDLSYNAPLHLQLPDSSRDPLDDPHRYVLCKRMMNSGSASVLFLAPTQNLTLRVIKHARQAFICQLLIRLSCNARCNHLPCFPYNCACMTIPCKFCFRPVDRLAVQNQSNGSRHMHSQPQGNVIGAMIAAVQIPSCRSGGVVERHPPLCDAGAGSP